MSGLVEFKKLISGLEDGRLKKMDSEGNPVEVIFKLTEPANQNEILQVEQDLGKLLPYGYKEFLLQYNGARLYDYEGLDGYVLLGTKDIVSTNRFVASTFEEDWIDNFIIFAKYIGEGNYLAFDSRTEEYKVVDCFMEELPQDWNEVASSFDVFLKEIIKSQGRKYWL